MNEQSTKQSLLDAAFYIVKTQGAERLTLSAVAEQAGVSKGGLLYHFPTKRELLQAMVLALIEQCNTEFTKAAATMNVLAAYVKVSLEISRMDETAALVAAVANDMALLDPLRAARKEWAELLYASGLPPAQVDAIRMAADGVWYGEVLKIGELSQSERLRVEDYLLEQIKECA